MNSGRGRCASLPFVTTRITAAATGVAAGRLRFRPMPAHRLARLCLGVTLLALPGCLRVEPAADYARTSALVRERIGEVDVFDPASEPMVEQRVTALLEGGLTVDEAVQVGLLANRTFQSLFAEIGASRADVVQSRLLTNPSLGFNAAFPEGGGRSELTLSFGQELVDLWQIPVRRRIAEQKLDQLVFDVARQGIDLVADIKSKCHRLLGLEQMETRVQENVALVKRSLNLADARFRAGEAGLLDLNMVKSNVLEAELELIGVRRDRRIAETDLARSLGLARWKSPWTLVPPSPLKAGDLPGDDGLVMLAMQQRFDAQAAARGIAAAEDELKRQWLNVFPSVMLGVEGQRKERRAMPGRDILADTARESIRAGALTAPDIMTRGERDQQRRQMIDALLGPTLTVRLPIYDQNQAQIAKADFTARKRRTEYEALLDQIAQEVQAAATTARAARDLVDFYDRQSLPQAAETLDAASRSYEAGEQNVLALINTQVSIIRLQREAIEARRDLAIALAELERTVGGRLPPDTTTGETTIGSQPTSIPAASGASPVAISPEALIEQTKQSVPADVKSEE